MRMGIESSEEKRREEKLTSFHGWRPVLICDDSIYSCCNVVVMCVESELESESDPVLCVLKWEWLPRAVHIQHG